MAAMRHEVLSEHQDALEGLRIKFDREKMQLEEQNRNLSLELDEVSVDNIQLRSPFVVWLSHHFNSYFP